mmetsp:Transcript_104906/g.254604  ORF Transcript_104906/g.254604 Transcript_104906/m.254604 type:complete len:303 (+) Transcript_104906:306-1214(+)
MPSLSTAINEAGFTICPGVLVIMSTLPSGRVTGKEKPVSASESVSVRDMNRSGPLRVKTACGFSSTTNTTSPGVPPGCWSASPVKVILSPAFMPRSMYTSRTLRPRTVRSPLQPEHLSSSRIVVLAPRHVGHSTWLCWIMPGPTCRIITLMPRPRQSVHVTSAPSLPPRPSQSSQMTLRVMASFTVRPLYRSSRETLSGWTWSSPFLGPWRPRRPPPPNMALKMSSASPPPPPPSSSPSFPYRSYFSRFSGSESTPNASPSCLNFSGSPPLSGWRAGPRTHALRYALRISSAVAVFSTPSTL